MEIFMILGYRENFEKHRDGGADFGERELVFVLEGCGSVDGVQLRAGQGFACFADERRRFVADGEIGADCFFLRFEAGENETSLLSLGVSRSSPIFDFSPSELAKKAVNCFFSEKIEYDNAMLRRGITDVMLSFILPAASEGKGEGYIEKTERYICENLHLPIKIDDIAASLSISRGYLRNLFYKHRGMSPQEYLMKLRIERAKELLSQGVLSVTEVAAAVGYSDLLGFSRIFKKHTGYSPSAYRNEFAISRDNTERSRDISIPAQKREAVEPNAKKEAPAERSNETESAVDTISALALEIEKAAAAAREEEAKKADNSPPPFWLL